MSKTCCHLNRRATEKLRNMAGKVCISISDPGSEMPILRHCGFDAVLSERFHDISEDRVMRLAMDSGYVVPNMDAARAIIDFIERYSDRSIVVHCEAGVSRSAAVCRFLTERGWGYRMVHCDMKFANPLLYSLLVKAFDELRAREACQ